MLLPLSPDVLSETLSPSTTWGVSQSADINERNYSSLMVASKEGLK
jgi:hypothetical protein